MCLDAGETMFATGDILLNKFKFMSLTYLKTLELDILIPIAKSLYPLSTFDFLLNPLFFILLLGLDQ